MKKVFYLLLLLFATALAACTGREADIELVLIADKSSIVANGFDAVTFAVLYGGEDITDQVQLMDLVSHKRFPTGENIITSDVAVDMRLQAIYVGYKSNEIAIKATEAPLKIVIDNPNVMYDGTEEAVVTVEYNGADVTSDAKLYDAATDAECIPDGDGVYRYTLEGFVPKTFYATYQDNRALSVAVAPRQFYHRVLALKFTGTWCWYCAGFGTTLKNLEASMNDRIVSVAAHVSSSVPDLLAMPGISKLQQDLRVTMMPSCSVEYTDLTKGAVSSSELKTLIDNSLQRRPALCGLKAESVADDNSINVKVSLMSGKEQRYAIAVFLIEDGITGYPQEGSSQGMNYVHDNTLRQVAGGFYGQDMGIVKAGVEVDVAFKFKLTVENKDNCRLVIFAADPDNNCVINAVYCPANGSVDYRFEE